MKIIRTNFLLLPGFAAINLFGVLIVRKDACVTDVLLNHEQIHTCQQRELLFVLFYIIYVLEWMVRMVQFRLDFMRAYRNISFEREAYTYQNDLQYLSHRRHFAQWRLAAHSK